MICSESPVGVPSISVVLPTFKRGEWLKKCLSSLLAQTVTPKEIVVGRRSGDEESAHILRDYSRLSRGLIREAVVGPNDNLVRSLNAAIAATTGELVAMTDDDAELPSDWLERLIGFFCDGSIGGVGGRDNQAINPGSSLIVGKLQWFGRLIGNHHLAIGPPRDVDVLKGVNCCYRGHLLREMGIDPRLRGKGNVANWELGISFAINRRGYRLIFDPSLQVTHHVGPRSDGDTNCRGGFNGPAHRDSVYNETLLLLEHLSLTRKMTLIGWSLVVGTNAAPGLFQIPRSMVKTQSIALGVRRWWYTCGGRLLALHSYIVSKGLNVIEIRP